MLAYLLDTNVLSALSKARPPQAVVDWCNCLQPNNWCIAQCTIAEIKRGIKLLRLNDEKRASAFEEWFDELLLMRPRIIPMSDLIIDIYTDLSVVPELQNLFAPYPGRFPASVGRDLEIAATAIAMRTTVATMNVKDFMQINAHSRLPGLFNPQTGEWLVRPRNRRFAEMEKADGHWDHHRRLGSKIMKG